MKKLKQLFFAIVAMFLMAGAAHGIDRYATIKISSWAPGNTLDCQTCTGTDKKAYECSGECPPN